jgi:hypothetical protein
MPIRQAYQALKDYAEDVYVDYHGWIFTQNSFVLIIKELNHLDLITIDIAGIKSDPGRCDFFVCLTKNRQELYDDTWEEKRLRYFKKVDLDILEQLIQSGAMEANPITDLIRENTNLKVELQRIYLSRAWRLVKFLKEVRLRLIPDNTMLHRLFVRIVK